MKAYQSIILLCFFQILICDELGGIKVVINDNFISSVLPNFEQAIKDKLTKGIKLKDVKFVKNMVLGVSDFSLDNVKISLGEDGDISINIKDIEPHLTGIVYNEALIKINKNFKITLQDFILDAKVRIKSRQLSSGEYAPDVEFVGIPDIKFKIDIDLEGSLGKFLEKVLGFVGRFASDIILPIFRIFLDDILQKVMSKLPTEGKIGNFWMDYTLASPIKLQNQFLELNSYALLFSKEFPETKNKKRYPLSTLPSISDSQFQLFVSEYSINSAAYTFLTVNKDNTLLKYNGLPITIINTMLPGVSKKYTNKKAELSFNPKPETNIKLSEEYMYINLPGTFYLKVEDIQDPVFVWELTLNLKAQLNVDVGPKITAKINDLTPTFGNILVNQATDADQATIEKGFIIVKNALVALINSYIDKKVKLPFPSIMGINFTDVKVQHKEKYILVNLNLN